MTSIALTTHPTGPAPVSPVAAAYDSVDRRMHLHVNGHTDTVTVAEAQQLARAICRASDSRTTAHPFDYALAADAIGDAIASDAAVA